MADALLLHPNLLQIDADPGYDELEQLLDRAGPAAVVISGRELGVSELAEHIWYPDQHPRWPTGSKNWKGENISGEFMRAGQTFMHNGKRWEIHSISNGKIIADEASGKIDSAETRVFEPATATIKGEKVPTIKGATVAEPWLLKSGKGKFVGAHNSLVVDGDTHPETHDPSIKLPSSSKLTAQDWQGFGRADQLYYVEVMKRYGAWGHTGPPNQHLSGKVKAAAAQANSEFGSLDAASILEYAFSEQKGPGDTGKDLDLARVFEDVMAGNKPALEKAWVRYQQARELEQEINGLFAWDMYNRVRAPDLSVRHKNDAAAGWWSDVIDGKTALMSGPSSTWMSKNVWHEPNSLTYSLPIRNIALAQDWSTALGAGSNMENEIASANRMKLNPDLATFWTPSFESGPVFKWWAGQLTGSNGQHVAQGGHVARGVAMHLSGKKDLPLPPPEANFSLVSGPGKPQYTIPPDEFMLMVENSVKKTPGKVITDKIPVAQLNLTPGDVIEGSTEGLRYLVIHVTPGAQPTVTYVALGKGAVGNYTVAGEKVYTTQGERKKVDLHFDIPKPSEEKKAAHVPGDWVAEGPKAQIKTFAVGDKIRMNGDDWEITHKSSTLVTIKSLSNESEGTVNAGWQTQKLTEKVKFEPKEGVLAVLDGKLIVRLQKPSLPSKAAWAVLRPDGSEVMVGVTHLKAVPSVHPGTAEKGDTFSVNGVKYTVTNVLKKNAHVRAKAATPGAKVEDFEPSHPALESLFRPTDYAVGAKHKLGQLEPGALVSGSQVRVRPYMVLGSFGQKTYLVNLDTGEQIPVGKNKSYPVLLTAAEAQAAVPETHPAPAAHSEWNVGDTVGAGDLVVGDLFKSKATDTTTYEVVDIKPGLNNSTVLQLKNQTIGNEFPTVVSTQQWVYAGHVGAGKTQVETPPDSVGLSVLQDAVDHGFAAFKSNYGPGGKYKHDKLKDFSSGQVVLDKNGKAWMVKQAGAEPIITDGQGLFKIDGGLKAKNSTHAAKPPVFFDNSPPVGGVAKMAADEMVPNTGNLSLGDLDLKPGDQFLKGDAWTVTSVGGEVPWGGDFPYKATASDGAADGFKGSLIPTKYLKHGAPATLAGVSKVGDLPVGAQFETPAGTGLVWWTHKAAGHEGLWTVVANEPTAEPSYIAVEHHGEKFSVGKGSAVGVTLVTPTAAPAPASAPAPAPSLQEPSGEWIENSIGMGGFKTLGLQVGDVFQNKSGTFKIVAFDPTPTPGSLHTVQTVKLVANPNKPDGHGAVGELAWWGSPAVAKYKKAGGDLFSPSPDAEAANKLDAHTIAKTKQGKLVYKTYSGQWFELGHDTPLKLKTAQVHPVRVNKPDVEGWVQTGSADLHATPLGSVVQVKDGGSKWLVLVHSPDGTHAMNVENGEIAFHSSAAHNTVMVLGPPPKASSVPPETPFKPSSEIGWLPWQPAGGSMLKDLGLVSGDEFESTSGQHYEILGATPGIFKVKNVKTGESLAFVGGLHVAQFKKAGGGPGLANAVPIGELPDGAKFLNMQPHLPGNGKIYQGHAMGVVFTKDATGHPGGGFGLLASDGKTHSNVALSSNIAKKLVVPLAAEPEPPTEGTFGALKVGDYFKSGLTMWQKTGADKMKLIKKSGALGVEGAEVPATPAAAVKPVPTMVISDMPDGAVYQVPDGNNKDTLIKKLGNKPNGAASLEMIEPHGGAGAVGNTWDAQTGGQLYPVVSMPAETEPGPTAMMLADFLGEKPGMYGQWHVDKAGAATVLYHGDVPLAVLDGGGVHVTPVKYMPEIEGVLAQLKALAPDYYAASDQQAINDKVVALASDGAKQPAAGKTVGDLKVGDTFQIPEGYAGAGQHFVITDMTPHQVEGVEGFPDDHPVYGPYTTIGATQYGTIASQQISTSMPYKAASVPPPGSEPASELEPGPGWEKLPAATNPVNLGLKPGDQFIDDDGDVHTVTEVGGQFVTSEWQHSGSGPFGPVSWTLDNGINATAVKHAAQPAALAKAAKPSSGEFEKTTNNGVIDSFYGMTQATNGPGSLWTKTEPDGTMTLHSHNTPIALHTPDDVVWFTTKQFPSATSKHLGLAKGKSFMQAKKYVPQSELDDRLADAQHAYAEDIPKAPVSEPEAHGTILNFSDAGVTLTPGTSAGGTTGAVWAKDSNGKSYVLKKYGGDQDRVATEALANAIYRELGVNVGKGGIIGTGPGSYAFAVEKKAGSVDSGEWSNEQKAAMAKDFVADALLANYDVIGLDRDNILWDGADPVRADQGGTLQYRAQGAKKNFGPEPIELWSMLGPKGQAGQNGLGEYLPESELRKQAAAVAAKLTPGVVNSLIVSAPFADQTMQAQVAVALKQRVAWLKQFGNGKHAIPPQVKKLLADEPSTPGPYVAAIDPQAPGALATPGLKAHIHSLAGKLKDAGQAAAATSAAVQGVAKALAPEMPIVPYGSKWASGGKFIYPHIAELEKGDLFRDKEGTLYSVTSQWPKGTGQFGYTKAVAVESKAPPFIVPHTFTDPTTGKEKLTRVKKV